MKKFLTGLLAGTLLMTSVLPNTAFANGVNPAVEADATEKEEQQETQDTVKDVQNNGQIPLGENPVEDSQEVELAKGESLLEYLYVESPYLETPAKENLVLSWGDGTEAISRVELLYQRDGQDGSFEMENKGGGLYLYQKTFSADESGVYSLTDIRVTESEQEYTYNLAEQGIKANFGVNEYYPGYEAVVANEISEHEEGVAVVSDEDIENSQAEEIVGEALKEAAGEDGQIITRSLKNARSNNGQIVVALDPGHCDKHAGAGGNGVREEIATLKIAQYCKAELEKYSGVKVYMTRTEAACPFPNAKDNVHDIRERVKAAAQTGADIYVSIHLNTSTSTAANGAEVWYPDGNQTPNTVGQGKELAQKIQNELIRIGLGNRGAKETDNNFACMDEGGKYNLPAVIVEHAFMSNVNDVNKYLKTEAGLKSLGEADANGIVNYFGLKKEGSKVAVEEGTYTFESGLLSQKVMSVKESSTDSLAPISIYSERNASSQRFEVISTGDGYYCLVAEHSGMAIEVEGGESVPGAMLQQNKLDKNSIAQKWSFLDAGNGYYYLRSALGVYMDVQSASISDGTPIWTYSFNGSNAQKWKLTDSNYQPLKDGTYVIGNAVNTNEVLDVTSASFSNFSNIQIYASNNTSAQHFEVSYVGKGYYKIIAEHSSKALDVLNGSTSNGANVQQYTWNNSDAQLWKFVESENGNYYLRSKLGNVLDIANSTAQSGTNVYLWEFNGKKSQQWQLKPVEGKTIKEGKYIISSSADKTQALTEKNGNIQLEITNPLDSQKVNITYQGDGYYKILLESSGKSLDVFSGLDKDETNLQQYDWNGSNSQLWKFINTEDGSYYIKSKLGTTIELASAEAQSGINIQMGIMEGLLQQKWVLIEAQGTTEPRPIENGTYTIHNGLNARQVLDVNSASESNGANVQLYDANNSSAQRFEVYYQENGYYKITAEHSGKVLDVANASNQVGANVHQYSWNGTEAQLWKIIDAGNGSFYLQSKLGTTLDISGNSAVLGTNVQMGSYRNSKAQLWTFTKAEYKTIEDGIYSFRMVSNKEQVLDIWSASVDDGANAQLYLSNDTDAQRLKLEYLENGYYKISLMHSGKILEIDVSSSNGNVQQNSWRGTDNQLWKFVPTGDGGYYIKSKIGTVLDVYCGIIASGTNIQSYEQNGTTAQKWFIETEYNNKPVAVTEGIYTVQSILAKDKVLDIFSGSTVNGANVQIFGLNDSKAQQFDIVHVSGDYYKIVSKASGKVLDILNGSKVLGANVQQYSWNGTDAQLWKFIDAGDGSYYIKSKLGTVLDIANGQTSDYSNVWTYTMNGSAAQKWKLIEKNEKLYKIMGKSEATADQMAKFYNTKATPEFPYPYGTTDVPNINEFCRIYMEECEKEGVKAEVAFAQAMLETGFLKFGGDVKKEQYNFAGLGAVGGGAPGESFPSIRVGIRAQVQHLKAYASIEPLNGEQVDNRFGYVKRGCAEYVQWLGMQENPNSTNEQKYGWAASANYGYNIVEKYIIPIKKL